MTRIIGKVGEFYSITVPELPWTVLVRVARVDGEVQIIGLRLEAPQPPGSVRARDLVISTRSLRPLNAHFFERARRALKEMVEGGTPGIALAALKVPPPTGKRPGRPPGRTEADRVRVKKIVDETEAASGGKRGWVGAAERAVAKQLRATPSSAKKLVREARTS